MARAARRPRPGRLQPKGRLLPKGVDHGDPIVVSAAHVQAEGSGRTPPVDWAKPFLEANREALARLDIRPEPQVDRGEVRLALHPGARLGAVALRAAVNRQVVAGLLIESRFGWAATGQVLGAVGYRVDPSVGGGPLVPGSAREVPPYIIAGPVLSRLGALIEHMTRGFIERTEDRTRPRGHVDWNHYGRRALPSGDWQRFRCTFPDLADDPLLLSAVRWTLARLAADLERTSESLASRALLDRTRILAARVGPGPEVRPAEEWLQRCVAGREHADWLIAAIEGMCWVADERGLGGRQLLDGLPWSLEVDRLWEAWVESFVTSLAQQVGARVEAGRLGQTQRPLVWHTSPRSLGHLVPDLALRWPDRMVWVDAKYKRHLQQLQSVGWANMSEELRAVHRADVHQALAYAALTPDVDVDTVLAYPVHSGSAPASPPIGVAEIASGRRRVRLMLAGLPFGFSGTADRDAASSTWASVLSQRN